MGLGRESPGRRTAQLTKRLWDFTLTSFPGQVLKLAKVCISHGFGVLAEAEIHRTP